MLQNKVILFLFLFIFQQNANGQSIFGEDKNVQRFAFYNVENLFDTFDDPNKPDEEFLPSSDKEWTLERYEKKLNQLAQVVEGMDYPTIIGLCEVENELVMQDLVSKTSLRKKKYGVVHFESPDYRGIDVGLLYKKKCFKVLEKSFIRINFPKEIVEDYTTRDVLVVKGLLHGLDTVYFMVNHWPSRRGGLKESSPKREYVAAQVRKRVEEIMAKSPDAKVILMGDFNDETDNKSVAEVLCKDDFLENAMSDLDEKGEGTYNYRGNWNMLDQFMYSPQMANKNKDLYFLSATIFKRDYLYFTSKKYGKTPTRTYGGKKYFGGYSDHLPVYVDFYQVGKKGRR